jgi:hypothetical protein
MFKPRPYDPNREDKQTPAQRSATARNFAIFRLRGLWQQASMLSEPHRTTARIAIDLDLIGRGALPQLEHEYAAVMKRVIKRQKAGAPHDPEDDIPF